MGTTNGFRRPERVRDRESGAERYDVERLQRRVLEGVQHWVNVANRVFANERNMPLPVPDCRFDLLGTCAGQACFPRRGGGPAYIRINVDLLERYPGLKEGLLNELLGDGNRYMDKYEAGYSFPTMLRFKCTKCLFAACQNF